MMALHRITNDQVEDAAKGYPYAYRSVVESSNRQIAEMLISLKQDILRLESENFELKQYLLLSLERQYKTSFIKRIWLKYQAWYWKLEHKLSILRKRRRG